MKIHPNTLSVTAMMPQGHYALRLLMFCGATVLAVIASTTVSAQTGLFGGQTSAAASDEANSVRNGLFTMGEESYQVVDSASFKTAADIGETVPGSIAQVSSCQSCQTGSGACGGNCGRGYRNSAMGYPLGNPCAPCNPFCYVSLEALYMERQGNENFTASRNFFLSEFDFEGIPRLTIGAVPDCVHGYEFSIVGRAQWDRFGAATDASGGLQTFLTAVAPFSSLDLSAFSDAERQVQNWSAEYWGFEANSTLVGYDVAKLLVGVRYIDYDENFNYFSQTATETGLFSAAVENQMIGLQCGMDLLYPVCRNGYTDFRSRAGVFANFADLDALLINNGSTVLLSRQDDTSLAGVLEIGGGLRYQVGDFLTFRVGGELWWLGGMATAPDQFKNTINSRREVRTKDDFVIAGATCGAEFRF
ncbi:MAG: hypothetical protein ACR2NZ_14820 [Rubripirellula sp.]